MIWCIDTFSIPGLENARFPDINHQDFTAFRSVDFCGFLLGETGCLRNNLTQLFLLYLSTQKSVPHPKNCRSGNFYMEAFVRYSTVQGLSTGGVFPIADMILMAENETFYGFGTHS